MVTSNKLHQLSEVSPDAASQALSDAQLHARTAAMAIDVHDYAGAVLLAYECARKMCLGLLLVYGYAPTGGAGEHAITFEAAEHFLSGAAATSCRDASFLRRERNSNMYRQQPAGIEDATEAADVAASVLTLVGPVLQAAIDHASAAT